MKITKLNERLLLKSIKHWEEMRDDPSSSAPTSRNCPLCAEYIEIRCVGCPVKAATGMIVCRGTPYAAAYEAWENYPEDSLTWRKAATAEIQFLRSLLPKKKGTK